MKLLSFENAYFHLFWKSIQAKWNAAPDRALSLWRHYAYPKLRSVWPTMKITPTTKRYFRWYEEYIFLFLWRKWSKQQNCVHTNAVEAESNLFEECSIWNNQRSQRLQATLKHWSAGLYMFFILTTYT